MIDRVHFSGEQESFFANINETEFRASREFVLREKAKLLKACLDIAILTEMAKRSLLSPKDIILFINKTYDVKISPGTLYPLLYRLERKGYIRKLPNMRKTLYVLGAPGKKVLEDFQQRLEEIQNFVICLLNK